MNLGAYFTPRYACYAGFLLILDYMGIPGLKLILKVFAAHEISTPRNSAQYSVTVVIRLLPAPGFRIQISRYQPTERTSLQS